MRRCRWWGEGEREGRRGRQELIGSSLYEPRPGYQMMQVEAGDLEKELQTREALHAPVTGVEYVCVKGVQGLREAGVHTSHSEGDHCPLWLSVELDASSVHCSEVG